MSSADTDTTEDTTEDTAGETGDDAAEDAPPTDERREALLERLAHHLGDDLVESHIHPGHELTVRVQLAAWKRTHHVLRHELGFRFFEFLSAIDWMPSPYGKSEDAVIDRQDEDEGEPEPIEQGTAGGETRFQVFSRLRDIDERDLAVIVKADVPSTPEGDPGAEPDSVESIIGVYPGANWHERETHEMFGIVFEGHPYLEKLYLPTGFEGHPLRKDYPLLAREVKPWPGIVDVEPMPDEGDDDTGDDESGEEADEA